MPPTVSNCMSATSCCVTAGVPAPMSEIWPFTISSSTSSDACQKKRYGEIVVPRIATMLSR